MLTRAANGDVCDAHERCAAVIGQVSRIRHPGGRDIKRGRGGMFKGFLKAGEGGQHCPTKDVSEGATAFYFRVIVIQDEFVTIGSQHNSMPGRQVWQMY
ncbi:MAG: hypothetical protein ABI072_09730, partial [Edaphobacter sp.]